MQYSILLLSTLAVSAWAQGQRPETDYASIVSVLETALPSSIIAEAQTNSAAASSDIAAEFTSGQTPSWFSALPTDIQTLLIPPTLNSTTRATGTGSISSYPTAFANSSSNATTTRLTTHLPLSTVTSTFTSDTGADATLATTTTSATSASSTGAASVPSAIVGMGLAGMAGVVGLLAL